MIKPTSKRKLQARQTREKLLNAALVLFEEQGFQNVSMEMIAEKAETAVGTIYHYFSSKEELAARTIAILDEQYEEFFQLLTEEELSRSLTPLQMLEEFYVYVQKQCGKQKWLSYGYIHDLKNGTCILASVNEKRSLYHCYAKLIERCRKADYFASEVSDLEIIEILTQSSRGLLIDWMLRGKDFDIEAQARKMIHIVIRGMLRQENPEACGQKKEETNGTGNSRI